MGKAKKRRIKLSFQLREQHPEWDAVRRWYKANDIDQREQARLQGIRWRKEQAAREARHG